MPIINRGGHFLLTEAVKETDSQNRLTEAGRTCMRWWPAVVSMGLADPRWVWRACPFFVFPILLIEAGRKTASENTSFTVVFAQRWLPLPASENIFLTTSEKNIVVVI